MNPFGPSPDGIDPQTGSYLSKEQRIAMFQASRGQGGSGGSAAGRGGAIVKAQSSIVVVNKLESVAKTLETNFQYATTNLSEQVAQNARDIKNIYEYINDFQDREIDERDDEIKEKVQRRQSLRMSMREKMIEGVAGLAVAGLSAGKKVAQAAAKPVMGFLERLRNALLLLGAAWFIRNMPSIISTLEGIFADFDKTKRELAKQLLKQRGWASGIEFFIRKLSSTVFGIARGIVRLGKFVASKFTSVTGKIFNALKTFTSRVFGHILGAASRLFKDFVEQAKRLVPNRVKDFVNGIKNSGVGRAVGAVANGARRVFGGVKDIFSDVLKGDLKSAVSRVTGGIGDVGKYLRDQVLKAGEGKLSSFKADKGIKTLSDSARASGLAKILKPITKLLGVSASAVTRLAQPLVQNFPVLGMLVDIGLNKAGGLEWVDAIVRGIASGLLGFKGAAVGMKLGALAGTAVMPGPGTVVGGALGMIVGSMVGGAIGDASGKAVLGLAGREQIDPEVPKPLQDFIAGEEAKRGVGTRLEGPAEAVKLNLPATFDGTASTPDGMNMPDGFGSTVNFNVTDMPPTTTKLSKKTEDPSQEVENPPALSATDSQMDPYRNLALTKYQLAF
jgi:hypothetical protein